jgi:hypothetical protein
VSVTVSPRGTEGTARACQLATAPPDADDIL